MIENPRDVEVRVSVKGNGRIVIKGLIVDGKPFDP